MIGCRAAQTKLLKISDLCTVLVRTYLQAQSLVLLQKKDTTMHFEPSCTALKQAGGSTFLSMIMEQHAVWTNLVEELLQANVAKQRRGDTGIITPILHIITHYYLIILL